VSFVRNEASSSLAVAHEASARAKRRTAGFTAS
jgi:hypothetical protein